MRRRSFAGLSIDEALTPERPRGRIRGHQVLRSVLILGPRLGREKLRNSEK
jgi:hypothetical protein